MSACAQGHSGRGSLGRGGVSFIGGDRTVKVNVRIVAATNRTLTREIEAGHFREDLYYRLAIIRAYLPPLRRRAEDIPALVAAFLEQHKTPSGEPVQVSYDTIIKLQQHRWPGNVRERRNFVERAAMLAALQKWGAASKKEVELVA